MEGLWMWPGFWPRIPWRVPPPRDSRLRSSASSAVRSPAMRELRSSNTGSLRCTYVRHHSPTCIMR
eukprot:1146208-Pelagomonas_calceolata.AAC.17